MIFWVSIIFIFIILYFIKIKKVSNFLNLLKAVFRLVKEPVIFFTLVYIAGLFYFFYTIDLLKELDLIKDYIKLIIFALIPTIYKVGVEYKKINVKELILSTLKLSMIPLFIISEYTFNIYIELVLILIASLLTLMVAVAETKPEFEPVRKLFNWLLAIIGFCVIVFAFTSFIGNLSDIKEVIFWKKMLLELLLLCHIPLLIFLQFTLYYEHVMVHVKIRTELAKSLKGRTKIYFLIFKNCRINKVKLEVALQKVKRNRIQTYGDLDQLLKG